jgi:hypothetical protein
MKKKVQKLVIHRETIRNLEQGTLSQAVGAADSDACAVGLPTNCIYGSCSCTTGGTATGGSQ